MAPYPEADSESPASGATQPRKVNIKNDSLHCLSMEKLVRVFRAVKRVPKAPNYRTKFQLGSRIATAQRASIWCAKNTIFAIAFVNIMRTTETSPGQDRSA